MTRIRLGLIVGVLMGSVAALGGALLASASHLPVAPRSIAVSATNVVVPASSPTITLVASAGGSAGVTPVTVAGTIDSGTSNATGTITFQLWSDLLCTQQFGSSSVVTVNGANFVVYESGALTPMTAMTYRWTASYSGDANNSPAITACGSSNSTVDIAVGAATHLVVSVQPNGGRGGEAWSAQPQISLTDAGGNLAISSTAVVTVAISTNPSGGTLTCTATAVAAVSGVAHFSGCTITTAGTGYTLVASSPGLTSVTSTAFDITVSKLSYSSIGAVATATSNSTVTVSYPSGTSANDLLFLVEVNSSAGNTATPTGWTLLADQSVTGATAFRFKVWSRLSGGETSVPLAFKAMVSGSSAWVVRYTRASGYPPNPATATALVRQGNSAASATLTPSTALTTNQVDATVINIAAIRAANTLSLGTPQSFTRRFSTTNVPAGGQGVALSFSDATTTVDPSTPAAPTWSQSGTAARWAWATVAFH